MIEEKSNAKRAKPPDAEGEADRHLPLLGQPMARDEKWKKKRKLSERSEFFSLPIFQCVAAGTPKGLERLGRAFCLLFGGTKSERLPGRSRRSVQTEESKQ